MRCEWDPVNDIFAHWRTASDYRGCPNRATLLLDTQSVWRLCETCAALPRFAGRARKPLASPTTERLLEGL